EGKVDFRAFLYPRRAEVARRIARRDGLPWFGRRGARRMEQLNGGTNPNVTLDNTRDELTVHSERAFLVSVALPDRPWIGDDPLEELRGLATTAGAVIVGGLTQRRQGVIPGTYIGKGKLNELQEHVKATDADVVIFDND